MPKISVIIPVYNTEKYIRQCLDSVVNQMMAQPMVQHKSWKNMLQKTVE